MSERGLGRANYCVISRHAHGRFRLPGAYQRMPKGMAVIK